MALFRGDQRSGASTARTAAIVGIAMAIAVGACGRNPASVTSPSGLAPVNLNADPGGDKYFTMTITPSVPANTVGVVLTVTVTNCDTGVTGCTTASSSTQKIGSAEIVIPAGFTVTAVGTPSGDQPGWGTTWTTGNTVIVGATGAMAGTHKLTPGQHETFTITVTTPSICDTFPIETVAASDSTLPATFGTDWIFSGDALSIETTGCAVVECPAAPSIAAHYLHFDLGIHPGSNLYQNIVSQVALHMGPETDFDGVNACTHPDYENAVKAYVNNLLP